MPSKFKKFIELKKDDYDSFMWLSFINKKIPCKDCVLVCQSKGFIPDCMKCIPSKTLITKARTTLEERRK